jgi:hypothetical protein
MTPLVQRDHFIAATQSESGVRTESVHAVAGQVERE